MRAAVLMAGVGGLLPTLARLAASFASDPAQPLPQWHILIALAIFFVLGCVIDLATNREADLRRAVLIGIAAPGLITNIVAGSASGASALAALSPPSNVAAVSAPVSAPVPVPIVPQPVAPPATLPSAVARLPSALIASTIAHQDTPPRLSIGRHLVVRVSVDGAPDTAVAVAIAAVAGQPAHTVPLGQARAGADLRLTLPLDATAITGTAGDRTATVTLPSAGDVALQASVTLSATGQGDLFWAFGAPRETAVAALGLRTVSLPD